MRKERGITLIALVITIVVLLILASVSIAMLTGDNGILSQAQKAKENTTQAAQDEENTLSDMNRLIEQMVRGEVVDNKTQEEKQQDTLDSFQVLSAEKQFFSMDYTADYKFDEYLLEGSSNISESMDFCSKNLLDGKEIEANDPTINCTTFSAYTTEGKWLYGRNMDDTALAPVLIVKTDPENGYKSVSTVDLAMLTDFSSGVGSSISEEEKEQFLVTPYIPLDGMNEKGVAIALLALEDDPINQNTGKAPITMTTLIRLVLDKAGSVDEAINLIQQYDMHSDYGVSCHYQISDKTGDSVVIEYVNNEFQVIRQKGEKFQLCTNFYLSPEMEGNEHTTGNTVERHLTVYNALKERDGRLEESEAKQLLKGVRQGTNGAYTKWSVLYNQTDLTLSMAPNADFDGDFVINLSL